MPVRQKSQCYKENRSELGQVGWKEGWCLSRGARNMLGTADSEAKEASWIMRKLLSSDSS